MVAKLRATMIPPKIINPLYSSGVNKVALVDKKTLLSKATEIRELQAQNKDTQSVQAQLQRVKELAKAYERIVEGNYVDNLIKAQNAQGNIPKARKL